MLRFIDTPRQTPEKRAAELRREDFEEVYSGFKERQAEAQASRCSQCGVPFCSSGCPLGNHIPDWLRLAAEDQLEEAWRLSESTSNMPEICGRICPQDRLCEGSCVIEQSGHGTVTIGAVEQYITDNAWSKGWIKPIAPARERPQSIGIIGAGPAGLSAADELRSLGYRITVYDRYDRAGGLMTYGIPGFKLEKSVVMRRVKRLADSGVTFVQNADIGGGVPFSDLREKHDAILIATGVYKARELSVPGVGANGVVRALDYLTASNRKGFGDEVPGFDEGHMNAHGKRVVVVGGGDTAMDCVRTAIRQDAASVTCLYRRDRENMPGSAREVVNAEEEGISFRWLSNPKLLLGDANKLDGIRVARMRLGPPDASGRQSPEEIPGEDADLAADMVIKALGFSPEDLPTAFDEPDLALTRYGTLKVDPSSYETSLPGVFAAGDIVRGASLVVWAIHDARRAAASIHQYFKGQTVGAIPETVGEQQTDYDPRTYEPVAP
ncbi:glutamate synthase, small subunit [Parvularcula bermudensis HTCC2503]|uniref:Glutamate synthase, small subunit n=1 Tax=Parvularcula bermudensis (strain ATCC BAA-594 / HTCC2503 / KCTC 12087) TaxID=314260 RepID=E0TCV6_PARBH|nr:NAD(P)-dependent oxidoreductase [Parvularcula bermudensis]ADM10339.1 glutamate synthase, small subunit [Parvularcula bermudensis HTCC2503]